MRFLQLVKKSTERIIARIDGPKQSQRIMPDLGNDFAVRNRHNSIFKKICSPLLFLCFCQISLSETTEEIRKKVSSVLTGQTGEYFSRTIERVGDKTIKFEAFISMEADPIMYRLILKDYPALPRWLLTNINQRPGGGNYYTQVQSMVIQPNDNSLAHLVFSVNLPVFKQIVERDFRLHSNEQEEVFNVSAETLPNGKSAIESAKGTLYLFKPLTKNGMTWVYVIAYVKLKNWVLYQALPDRLLKRESGERIGIVLANYQKEEDLRKSQLKFQIQREGASKLNQIPKEK